MDLHGDIFQKAVIVSAALWQAQISGKPMFRGWLLQLPLAVSYLNGLN